MEIFHQVGVVQDPNPTVNLHILSVQENHQDPDQDQDPIPPVQGVVIIVVEFQVVQLVKSEQSGKSGNYKSETIKEKKDNIQFTCLLFIVKFG